MDKRNKLIPFLCIIIVLALTIITIYSLSALGDSSKRIKIQTAKPNFTTPGKTETPTHPDKSKKSEDVVVSFAGDCTFGSINGSNSATGFLSVYSKSKSISYPFDDVKSWFINDDLTVVNFEGTLTDATKTADKQWLFKGPAGYAKIFPASSVEVADLSNNHSFDYLKQGFTDTIKAFQKQGVGVCSTDDPFVTRIKGTKVVVISDCSVVGENTTVTDGVAERVIRQIKKYKNTKSIVIVDMHWGSELDKIPTKWQQATGRMFIDAGADLVVGQHPHVLQGIELYKGKYIVYSLGNFAFGGNRSARYPETIIFRMRFSIDEKKIQNLSATIVPCYITSSQEKTSEGLLQNNFKPKPLFGTDAKNVINLILERSRQLNNGIKKNDLNYGTR